MISRVWLTSINIDGVGESLKRRKVKSDSELWGAVAEGPSFNNGTLTDMWLQSLI